MAYKIAVGSSDGINVDLKFGEVENFLIYEVTDNFKLIEQRAVPVENDANSTNATDNENDANVSEFTLGSNCEKSNCKSSGCGGNGGGCGGAEGVLKKVSLIEDCRCVVCRKVGFQAQKQFEKKAISVFDVEVPIEEALEKITYYYEKIDNHKTLRS
jgi:predicted Fe-Mo cluster-binding NifX family protein